MTFPATDTPRPQLHAALTAASDRPIWDSSAHTIKLVVFSNSFIANGTSGSAPGHTAYAGDTTGKYSGTSTTDPWYPSNGEPAASGGYSLGGFTMAGVTSATSSGKEVVTANFLTIGSGGGLTLSTSIYGGAIWDSSATSGWILSVINWGAALSLADPDSITFQWPQSPVGTAGVSGTIWYVG